MKKWIEIAQQFMEMLETQVELQQTTNRLLAAILDQQQLAENRRLAIEDAQREQHQLAQQREWLAKQ